MIDVISGTTTKPASSKRLAETLQAGPNLKGTLYVGYPILGTPDGAFPVDAILLSPDYGLVAFDIVEGRDVGDYQGRQDNLYSKLQAKLLQYPALVNKRQLITKIQPVTFAPAVSAENLGNDDYPVFSNGEIVDYIADIVWDQRASFPALAAAIQALSNIRKGRRRRDLQRADSRGAKLQKLNDSIANLDVDQGAAVVETVEGVQRIRGLAGSGKTIVLALKVAYLHAQHPDWKIAVTFNTRSLKGQFERLINTFVIEQTNEEPDWQNIDIVHSWGSPSASAGMYYKFVKAHGLTYYDFQSARNSFGVEKEFSGACDKAINEAKEIKPKYDAILVDEAQDLPSSFLQLCYLFLKVPKRLVYAYDELQSLTNVSLLPPEELFGKDQEGQPLVSFSIPKVGDPRQDIILERCYRNSRPILVTAHALGFGIYREPGGLIQIFDQSNLWSDVGYRVTNGELADGKRVTLARTDDTSPRFLEAHSPVDDLIVFQKFDDSEQQDDWLVEHIKNNISNDELSPDDIIVINPDPLKTRKAVAAARSKLFQIGINSSLAGVSSSPDVFFENDLVTFTGIFRAKGNEAAMVYVINAQDCFDAFMPAALTLARNQLFTAITRSKAWVRVLGVGQRMQTLIQEYERIKAHNYTLNFVYPDAERRKELKIINRDMTAAERSKVTKSLKDITNILQAIEDGDVKLEDLPLKVRQRLKRLL
jgi:superfamily I DNA and RNA helicase